MATAVVWVLGWGPRISTTDSAQGPYWGVLSAPRTAFSGGPSVAAPRLASTPYPKTDPIFQGPGHLRRLEASSQLPLLQ